jgi:hypothetical protein
MDNLPTTMTDVLGAIEAIAANETGAGGGEFTFMKMTKQGEWLFGQDNTEVEAGSEWMIDPRESQMGYISWGDGGPPLGEVMGGGKRPPVNRADLPDTGFAWDIQKAIQLICVSGEDAGTAVIYKTNSKGGNTAISRILQDVAARARSGNADVFPIVKLTHTSGKSNWGTVCYPELKQVKWADVLGFDEMVAGDATIENHPEPEPEPSALDGVGPTPPAATPIRRRRKRTT